MRPHLPIFAAALLGVGVAGFAPAQAAAVSIPSGPALQTLAGSDLQLADHSQGRPGRDRYEWDRRGWDDDDGDRGWDRDRRWRRDRNRHRSRNFYPPQLLFNFPPVVPRYGYYDRPRECWYGPGGGLYCSR